MSSSQQGGVPLGSLPPQITQPPAIYTTAAISATAEDFGLRHQPQPQPQVQLTGGSLLGAELRGSVSSSAATAVPPPDPVDNHPRAPSVNPEEALRNKFHDFDNNQVYRDVCGYAIKENSLNFVVQFGDNSAEVAYGLDVSDFRQLLQQSSPDLADGTKAVRWINVWNPSNQRKVIEAIGEHYHFSKRLQMSIWAWDLYKKELLDRKNNARKNTLYPTKTRKSYPPEGNVIAAVAEAAMSTVDLEGGKIHAAAARNTGFLDRRGDASSKELEDLFAPENLATFKMMQDSLNYTTMDQESKFICIGANWLHRRPTYTSSSKKKPSLVPPKHWSWFVLCDDHTIISFHEAAYYDKAPKGQDLTAWQEEELKHMRSNTIKVLRQLSTCGLAEDRHKFTQLTSIRQPGRHDSSDAQRLEGSSNLFYYLFEDYAAAFHILDSSKTALDEISGRILRTADWKSREDMSDIIPMLYKLNKELRQLHHLFTNYKNVIGRLIRAEVKISSDADVAGMPLTVAAADRLSLKAATRFKRLQVQMQSLMLDVITDYLDEKRSLQETYFNLMTQKDSHSTERLTRSATLLAKLSVFFLPISFMTSYFSVQIPHMSDSYTAWTYWGSFAVIASVSFLSLFFFSKVLMFLSESLDHAADRATRWTYGRVGWAQRKKMRAMEEDDKL